MKAIGQSPLSTHCGHYDRLLYSMFKEATQIEGMNPRNALLEKLKRHPELSYSETPVGVRIEPLGPNGFAVALSGDEGDWTVSLGEAGFHETFSSGEEALKFIAWCYSGEARLREFRRGRSPEKAILESLENGEWRSVSETGLIFVPFWRQRHEEILANPRLAAIQRDGSAGVEGENHR